MNKGNKVTRRDFCTTAAATVAVADIPVVAAEKRNGLKPMIKYRGGKSKELAQYFRFIPKQYGMIRFNAQGHFNVPFGRYEHFNIKLVTREHSRLLQRTGILYVDYGHLKETA